MSRLVLATGNPGKLREFKTLLAPLGWTVVAQRDLGIVDADEPHPTFVENALAKARHASAASDGPALADDSGLCVDALDGAPGVHSARYADASGDRETRDALNNAKLLAALDGTGRRTAAFVCVLVFVRNAGDPEPLIATGRWHGAIVGAPRGSGGFGYDVLFLPRGIDLTAGELPAETKNRISHRAIATRRLIDELAVRRSIAAEGAP